MAPHLQIRFNDEISSKNNTSGKQKKRSNISTSNTNDTISNTNGADSIISTKPIYGCPPGFQKASEYLCLHLSRNSTGHTNKHTFSQSKFYCESKGHGANVVSISNIADASAIWKWISNHFYSYKSFNTQYYNSQTVLPSQMLNAVVLCIRL